MTGDQANHLIGELKGLFPTLTPEQASYLRREFLHFESGAVERAINQHARIHPAVNLARLLEQVREAGAVAPPDWQRQFAADRDRAASEARQVDAALRSISDQELERYKLDALNELDPKSREFVEKLDARTSPTLRALIYRRLFASAAAAR